MSGQRKKRRNLPHMVRQEIIQDYLSGRKSSYMLSVEYDLDQKSINKMVNRYKQKNTFIFEDQLSQPIMGRKKKQDSVSEDLNLKLENQELKRQLHLAQLKLEGYQIMGDILEEEYGIDLLKKSAAKQSSGSKNDTQE